MKLRDWLNDDFFKNLLKNVLILLSGNGLASILGLLSLTLTLKFLGATDYGLFILIQTYSQIFDGLFNFQSWQALIKYGAVDIANNDRKSLKKHIKLSFILDIGTAIIGIIFASVLIFPIGKLLGWSSQSIKLVQLYNIYIIMNIRGTPIGILRLFNRFYLQSWQSVILAVLKLIVLLLLITIPDGLSLVSYTISLLCLEVTGSLLIIFFSIYTLWKEEMLDFWEEKIDDSKSFLRFSIWSNIGVTLSLPIREFDKIAIARIISVEALAVYDFFKKVSKIVSKFIDPVYQAVYPELGHLIAHGKKKKALHSFYKLTVILLSVSACAIIIIWIFSGNILMFLFDPEYIKFRFAMVLFISSRLVGASFAALTPLLVASGNIKQTTIIDFVTGLAYFLGILVVGRTYSLNGITIIALLHILLSISMKMYLVKRKL